MLYKSTRGGDAPKTFTEILMTGLSPDGGLYVPETWPQLDWAALQARPLSYVDTAEAVIAPFVTPDIAPEALRSILEETYGKSGAFNHADVVPLVPLNDTTHLMELFHGPTLAFKDVALQFLGRLFDHVLEKQKDHLTIIGATSGDTGSAAIEACRDRSNITVFILHPHNRTSDVQRRQMTSVQAKNINNLALQGTFDDCQSTVKTLFNDADLKQRLKISAINSINWARIIAQTVYYVHACLKYGPLSFAVPTGNFGNVYAAYVAKKMGAPVQDLIIGSNRNDILTRFFETGKMQQEGVKPSYSPSMDIQISSNFERYLYDLLDGNAQAVADVMNDFAKTGSYVVSSEKLAQAKTIFHAYRCDDDETVKTIQRVYQETKQIIDPHTAVGANALYQHRQKTGLTKETAILACAHPAKFPDVVEKALGIRVELPDFLADLYDRPERFDVIENNINAVKQYIIDKTR